MSAGDYDALQETIAVLGDTELLHEHLEAMRAIDQGDVVDHAELIEAMQQAGRLPVTP